MTSRYTSAGTRRDFAFDKSARQTFFKYDFRGRNACNEGETETQNHKLYYRGRNTGSFMSPDVCLAPKWRTDELSQL